MLKGRLASDDYSDTSAADPAIDRLRELIHVTENPDYSASHHDPRIASCASGMHIVLEDGQISPFVEIPHPAGDPVRHETARPQQADKFHRLTRDQWPKTRRMALLDRILDVDALLAITVNDFITSVG